MSKAFEKIKTGLEEAIAHAEGDSSGVVVHEFSPVDVKELRKR